MSRLNAFSFAMAAGVGLLSASFAEAAMVSPPLLSRVAAPETGLVVKTQYIYGGQNYCWYLNGWQGPGWYWCGYAWDEGLGWGGGYGWNGWGGGRGRVHSGERAEGRDNAVGVPAGAPEGRRGGGALGGHLGGALGGRIGGRLGGAPAAPIGGGHVGGGGFSGGSGFQGGGGVHIGGGGMGGGGHGGGGGRR